MTMQATDTSVRTSMTVEDRHGDGWEQMRDAVGSANGWNLQPFADAARTA